MYKRMKIVSVAVMLVALLGACAGAGQTTGAYVDDSAITAKVKARLVEDPRTSAIAINVDTHRGTVQLSGFAKDADEKKAATEVARSVSGVKDVKNDLILKN
jgi:hyperosmotically inducible periplasmic protein